eukprot:1748526-Rhodomonas_salina.2
MTLLATEPTRLPFCLNVPPLTAGVPTYNVTDHIGLRSLDAEHLSAVLCADVERGVLLLCCRKRGRAAGLFGAVAVRVVHEHGPAGPV